MQTNNSDITIYNLLWFFNALFFWSDIHFWKKFIPVSRIFDNEDDISYLPGMFVNLAPAVKTSWKLNIDFKKNQKYYEMWTKIRMQQKIMDDLLGIKLIF